ncbi:hypothetical protein CBL_08616 [Carabus blaptoides fortunei]
MGAELSTLAIGAAIGHFVGGNNESQNVRSITNTVGSTVTTQVCRNWIEEQKGCGEGCRKPSEEVIGGIDYTTGIRFPCPRVNYLYLRLRPSRRWRPKMTMTWTCRTHNSRENNKSFSANNQPWYANLRSAISQNPTKCPDWRVERGNVYKLIPDPRPLPSNLPAWKLVVPPNCRDKIVEQCHDSPLAAHLGFFKTLKRVVERYYCPGMRASILRYVTRCKVCLVQKAPQPALNGLMGSMKNVSFPWQAISIDLMGPLPRSTFAHCYILVVSDWFSKYPCDAICSDLPSSYANSLTALADVFKNVEAKLLRAHERNALRRRPVSFSIGDTVWKRNYVLSDAAKHFASKLAPRYVLCRVYKKFSPVSYHLKDANGKDVGTISMMTPHRGTLEKNLLCANFSLLERGWCNVS